MFNPRDVIDLIALNVRKSRNPFGIPNSQLNAWWRDLPAFTRRPGSALLFTGLMYQAIPYIEATTSYLERLEDSPRADYLRFGGLSRYLPASLVGRGLSFLTTKLGDKKVQRHPAEHLPALEEIRGGFFLSSGDGFL